MIIKYGELNLKEHIADTRDTLCYATNDNQNSTLKLLETNADAAFVVGGYNSSNTTHLIEILESRFPCFFIKSAEEILDNGTVNSFNIHSKQIENKPIDFLNYKNMIITSGASCPDSILEKVVHRLSDVFNEKEALEKFTNDFLI
jgi:4-hydroxy-3-methylbut-2-enyl diphosphate reductase